MFLQLKIFTTIRCL